MTEESKTPIVKWDDIILGGATSYDWETASGTTAVQRVFTVSKHIADKMLDKVGEEGVFEIISPGGSVSFLGVYLLEVQPGEDPFTRRLRFADARWKWPNTWVSFTANRLRRTGAVKITKGENNLLPDEAALTLPELKFAKWSLFPVDNPTTPWTAVQCIEEVFSRLGQPVTVDPAVFKIQVPIQNLDIEANGADAVDTLLDFLPGAEVYIDDQGVAVVYDSQSMEESTILAKLGPPRRGTGTVEIVEKAGIRPSAVHVLFTPEVEVKFTYEEEPTGTQTSGPSRVLKNVGIYADPNGTLNNRDFSRGSWIEMSDLFELYGAWGKWNRQATFTDLRNDGYDYGSRGSFLQLWGNNPDVVPDPLNQLRASLIVQHWRRSFKIDPDLHDRLAHVRPYRVSVLNQVLYVFAPSEVYSDWIRRPTMKGMATQNSVNRSHGWAVRGYADDISGAVPAPVRVSVLDEQAGIITFDVVNDLVGLGESTILGYPEEGTVPVQDMGAGANAFETFAAQAVWNDMTLEKNWKCSTVMTVVPGAPNNNSKLLRVTIKPEDIEPGVGECKGPPIYMRILPGVVTARFAWDDNKASTIDQALTVGGAVNINTLWDEGLLTNEPQLTEVAKNAARRVYDALRDRPMGNISNPLTGHDNPGGTLDSVQYVMQGGMTETRYTFRAARQYQNIWGRMDPTVRLAILRILNQPAE